MTRWIVLWYGNGEWKCSTIVWETDKEAEKFAKDLVKKNKNKITTVVTPIRIPY